MARNKVICATPDPILQQAWENAPIHRAATISKSRFDTAQSVFSKG